MVFPGLISTPIDRVIAVTVVLNAVKWLVMIQGHTHAAPEFAEYNNFLTTILAPIALLVDSGQGEVSFGTSNAL
jgi:hypothetical protein